MLKNFLKKLKNSFLNEEGDNKKKIENLIVILVILVITIIAINFIWNDEEPKSDNINNVYKELAAENETNLDTSYQYDLEENLEDILSNISGVRKSKSINYIFKYK